MEYKNKKVLLFGLGILGGGIATANWLLKKGVKLTITDLKTADQLKDSISKLISPVKLSLGGHSKKDIDNNEIVVLNQDISINNEYVQYAFSLGKLVLNEAGIFFEEFKKPIVAVTGTRGKSTTTAWINHFLNSKFRSSIAGNNSENPYLLVLDKKDSLDMVVLEVPSFQLEFVEKNPIQPKIAVITNISQDHLNRHDTMEKYADAKANIFKYQITNDQLILNADDGWTKFFLSKKPKAGVKYFSMKKLPAGKDGLWFKEETIYFKDGKDFAKVLKLDNTILSLGEHNIYNLLASMLAANLAGCSWPEIQGRIKNLPMSYQIVFGRYWLLLMNLGLI